jgi:hypothetical protein
MRRKTYRRGTITEAKVRNFPGPGGSTVSTTPVQGNGIKTGFEVAAMQGRDASDDTHLSPGGDISPGVMSVYCSGAECA